MSLSENDFKVVRYVSILGLIPFAIGLYFSLFPAALPLSTMIFERALIGYSALVLAFLGGVRWGMRMQSDSGTNSTYIMGALGSLLGLSALLMPYPLAIAVLIVGFGAQGVWDVWSGTRGNVLSSYARLRRLMTVLVCFTLMGIILAQSGTVATPASL